MSLSYWLKTKEACESEIRMLLLAEKSRAALPARYRGYPTALITNEITPKSALTTPASQCLAKSNGTQSEGDLSTPGKNKSCTCLT